jgi:hypothetical protein
MKKTGVVMMISLVAFLQGRAYAAPRATSSQQASAASSSNAANDNAGAAAPAEARDAKPAARQAKWRVSPHKKRSSGHSGPARANTSPVGTGVNHYPLGSTDPGGAAQGGSMKNRDARYILPIPARGVNRAVRHRSPNPAVIVGGWGKTSYSSGVIDGTWMSRKP